MKKNILIVEDEKDICEILKLYLESEEYNVLITHNGLSALHIMQNSKVDMALVDIMMPMMNGYDFIKSVRETNGQLPIIVISAKNLDNDKIIGLNLGADIYITKPFNPLEVIANIKALFRRCDAQEEKSSILVFDNIVANFDKFVITKDDIPIQFTATELKILFKLMKNPNCIFTKAQLCECINGEYFECYDNSVTVHISNIRAKLEDNPSNPIYIKTVKGLGYKFSYEKE